MSQVIEFGLLGLATGAMYALASQGLILVYRGSGVLNFAQGATAMAGAFIFYQMRQLDGWGFWPALMVALAVGAALGVAMYFALMRPLRRASALMRIIATLGALTVIQAGFELHYGSNPLIVPSFLPTSIVKLGSNITIGVNQLIITGIVLVLTIILWQFYGRARFGLATTAMAENHRAAAAMGWSPDLIAAINWGLGGILAALAGVLLAPIAGLQVDELTQVVIAAFAGALIANFRSFPLALLGGLAVGIVGSELGRYVSTPGIAESAPFLVIIAWLVISGRALPIRGQFLDRLPSIGTGRVRIWIVAPAILITVVLTLWVFAPITNGAVTNSMVIAIVLLSLVVLTGYCGQLSLGQLPLAGVGALIAGRLIQSAGMSFLPALLIATVLAVPIGMLFAVPALRSRGANLAIATLGIGLAINFILFGNPSIIGGVNGTQIGTLHIFSLSIDDVAHPARYGVVVIVAFVLIALAVASLRRGRAGRRLIAVRSNERAAASIGVNVLSAKLYAFGLSSAIATVGGVLLAFQGHSILYTQFDITDSILLVSYIVIGGLGYISGSLLGSTLVVGGVFQLVIDHLASVDNYINLISGGLLLAVILINSDGMAIGTLDTFLAFRRRIWPMRAEPQQGAAQSLDLPSPEHVGFVPAGDSTLEVQDLEVRFGGTIAVDKLSMTVCSGQVVGLIGPNGAGKTTVVDAITGFVSPAAGAISLDGQPIQRLPVHRRARMGVARSFQSLELFEDLTVKENLYAASDRQDMTAYVSSLVGGGSGHLTGTARIAIEEFGLLADLDRRPEDLPYGRRRTVAIARAIASSPRILILDEPAAGISSIEAENLGTLIRTLAERLNVGILLIEHNVDLVLRVCDEITVLDFGRTIASGKPADIRRDPQVRSAYLGQEVDELVEAGAATAGSS